MIRIIGATVMTAVSWSAEPRDTTTRTWTGWISDKQCARVTPGEDPRPNGTACVKKCLAEGSPAVFISEQAKAVYEVLDYPSAPDYVGFRLEVTGEVNEKTRTVSVKSVKRLSEIPNFCLPKKAVKK